MDIFPGQTIAPIATTYVGREWFGEIIIEQEETETCAWTNPVWENGKWVYACEAPADVLVQHHERGHVPACARCAAEAGK